MGLKIYNVEAKQAGLMVKIVDPVFFLRKKIVK